MKTSYIERLTPAKRDKQALRRAIHHYLAGRRHGNGKGWPLNGKNGRQRTRIIAGLSVSAAPAKVENPYRYLFG